MKFGDVEVNFNAEPKTPDVSVVSHGTPHLVPRMDLGEGNVDMQLSADQQKLLEDMEVVDMSIVDPVQYENYAIDQLVSGGRSLDA